VTLTAGAFTVKVVEFDAPPPGVGFVTTTGKLPAVARSLALKLIVNCVALADITLCPTPLYVTAEEERKFDPLMVSAWDAAPAVAEDGERLLMPGAGLLTAKFATFEAPPPGVGFVTTTE
jgi:hypothetical protein